jgi:hypothetical protein
VNFATTVESEPFGLKCVTEVDEDLARLRCEVAFTDQFTGFADRYLTGNE